MIPKEDADMINPWRVGGTLNNAIALVTYIVKAKENKLTISEVW